MIGVICCYFTFLMSVVYLQKQQIAGFHIVTILGVAVDGVWISEWIY
jgi:hypothetical protein